LTQFIDLATPFVMAGPLRIAPPSTFEAYYVYDKAGNLTTRNINQYQTHTTSSYDVLNRLTQAQHFLAGSSPKVNYGYDEMSSKAYEQRDSSLADGFGYNLNNELTSFRRMEL
jgi:hypothetical protein